MAIGPWPHRGTSAASFRPPRPLGVGCSVLPDRLDVLARVRHLIDVVEVRPDLFAQERPTPDGLRTVLDPNLVEPVLAAIGDLPVIAHGLELSIGSAHGWNDDALEVLEAFGGRCEYRWHSEHLGFLGARGADGGHRHAGIPLPLPFTAEVADLVGRRADAVAARTGRPFLLENGACYLPDLPHDPGWDESRFLSELCARSRCGLLLDLFNLHVNATDHGLDSWDLLSRLPLDRVVEVHLAGGEEEAGFLLDSHSRVVPEAVWELAEWLLPRAPNVGALIFEVLQESFDTVGMAAYVEQVDRLADLWHRSRPALGQRSPWSSLHEQVGA